MTVAAWVDRRDAHRAPLQDAGFVFGMRVAGAGALQRFVRIIVKFDLTATNAPNDTPAVVVRELAQIGVAHGLENFQLSRMRDKVLRSARQ